MLLKDLATELEELIHKYKKKDRKLVITKFHIKEDFVSEKIEITLDVEPQYHNYDYSN